MAHSSIDCCARALSILLCDFDISAARYITLYNGIPSKSLVWFRATREVLHNKSPQCAPLIKKFRLKSVRRDLLYFTLAVRSNNNRSFGIELYDERRTRGRKEKRRCCSLGKRKLRDSLRHYSNLYVDLIFLKLPLELAETKPTKLFIGRKRERERAPGRWRRFLRA